MAIIHRLIKQNLICKLKNVCTLGFAAFCLLFQMIMRLLLLWIVFRLHFLVGVFLKCVTNYLSNCFSLGKKDGKLIFGLDRNLADVKLLKSNTANKQQQECCFFSMLLKIVLLFINRQIKYHYLLPLLFSQTSCSWKYITRVCLVSKYYFT